MNLSGNRLRRLVGIFVLVFVGIAGAFTLGGSAAAHHPVLEAQTDRLCGDQAPWTAIVTAQSDQDWNKDWKSKYQIDGGPFSAWSPLTDDQTPYVFEVGPFGPDVTKVSVLVKSKWYLKSDGTLSVTAQRSIEILRPDTWRCAETTKPAAPAVTYDCATDQLNIVGADDTDSVDYTVTVVTPPNGEGSTWDVTITAAPQPGYEFADDATTEWHFTGTVDCLQVTTPAAPELTCRVAPDKGLALQLTPSDTYSYEVSGNLDVNEGDPYDVTVVAVPAPGYEFPAEATSQWSFTGVVECQRIVTPTTTTTTIAPTTTTTTPGPTAITGSSSTGLLLAYASVMTLLGGLLMLIKRSFRPERP